MRNEAKPATLAVAKVPTLKAGDDAATAKQLEKLFTEAQSGMRRIVAVGLFAWEIKETQLKHGEFGPWLEAHAPKLCRPDAKTGRAKPSAALSNFMGLTKGVLENVGFKTIGGYLKHISNSHGMGICHGGKFLLLPEKKVTGEARPLREKIFTLIDGKTQRQLFLEFKQSEDDAETPKRGRLKGQGGASAKQRLDAKERERLERLETCEADSLSFISYAEENADDLHLGELKQHNPELFSKVADAHRLLGDCLKRLNK